MSLEWAEQGKEEEEVTSVSLPKLLTSWKGQ